MLKLLKYLKPYSHLLALSVGLIILQALSDVLLPYFMADIVNVGIANQDISYIWQRGGMMLGVALIFAACLITAVFLSSVIAARFARDIRQKIFIKVQSFSNTEMDKFTCSSLITRSTNDIMQIQQLLVFVIRMVFLAPILGIGATIFALRLDPGFDLTWLIILAIGLMVVMLVGLILIVFPRFEIIQKLVDKTNLAAKESLSGMMVIRAFNKQKLTADRFDKVNTSLKDHNMFVNRVMAGLMPILTLIISGLTIIITWVGMDIVADSGMQIGDMMAVTQYAMAIVFAFVMMAMIFIMVPRASVAARRIVDVLETDVCIKEPTQTVSLEGKAKGVLKFDNVSYKYQNAEIEAVKGVSFEAQPNKLFAIIGSTGSGKSTISNLMSRFYDVTEGSITLDGVDIRQLSLCELRKNISLVPQKSLLFSGTVLSNLTLAHDIEHDAIYSALDTAQIKGFIEKDNEGLNKPISQGGVNVSGGQRQRLAIARALAKDASVLVFDDSFSALDFKTDAKLRRALKLKQKDKTIIIIAQRIGTIKDADQILVLDGGKVVGQGKHKYLLENCKEYREIALSQLEKEEL